MFSFDDKLADPNHAYSGDEDALNDAEVNGNWTPQEKALHEARLKAKAKRRLRKSSSRNSTSESFSESGDVAGGDPNSPKGKVNTNDRKSRTGKGRGLPKKGMFGVCSFLFFFFFFFLVFQNLIGGLSACVQVGQVVKEFGGLLGWYMKSRSLMYGTRTMMKLLR